MSPSISSRASFHSRFLGLLLVAGGTGDAEELGEETAEVSVPLT